LAGDFNASIGCRSSNHDAPHLGPYGIAHWNENGERLLELITALDLRAATTYFKHKTYGTFIDRRNSDVRRTLDHFMTSRLFGARILDACHRYFDDGVDSDHDPVSLKLRLSRCKSRSKANRPPRPVKRRIDWSQLIQVPGQPVQPLVLEYQTLVEATYHDLLTSDSTHIPTPALLSQAVMHAAESLLEKDVRPSLNWFEASETTVRPARESMHVAKRDYFLHPTMPEKKLAGICCADCTKKSLLPRNTNSLLREERLFHAKLCKHTRKTRGRTSANYQVVHQPIISD
jgi:hypothetical protein